MKSNRALRIGRYGERSRQASGPSCLPQESALLPGGTAVAWALLTQSGPGRCQGRSRGPGGFASRRGLHHLSGPDGRHPGLCRSAQRGGAISGSRHPREHGLQPHIEDVARRFALEGFHAIAPDALSPLGGTPSNTSQATPDQPLNTQATIRNFVAAVQYLKTHPQTTGNVGCTGFCWGGAMTNQVAVNAPDLAAAVPFYGSAARGGGCAEDQSFPAVPLRRPRHRHQRRHRSLRSRTQGRRPSIMESIFTKGPAMPSSTIPRQPITRRRRISPGG